METAETGSRFGVWYNKYYKLLLIIPFIIFVASVGYVAYFYSHTGDFILRDTSLSGGTSITLQSATPLPDLEEKMKEAIPDVSVRTLTDIQSGETLSYIIESSAEPDAVKAEVETIVGYPLTEKNSSIEFTGPTLSEQFYQQLIFALIISFILMSLVVFVLFRSVVPSMAVISAVIADIITPLAIVDYFGIRISGAGIAAFLMLIGYSVDTDILLTSRVLKREGNVNQKIFGAFKTGIFMTTTALCAIIPSFFISGLPDSFQQIFLILFLGLVVDILNTWITNASLLKWYVERRA
ncbi:MAG: hypothetical protein RL557_719 [archaeon]|jgi:preprotein translocase subunit SecF